VADPRHLAAARLAAKQAQVLRLEQLRSLGFSDKDIRVCIQRGLLYPIHRGVYAWGTPILTDRGHLLAAQWACGDKAFFSGATAAAVYGHGRLNRRAIELTKPGSGGRTRKDDNLVIRRTRDRIDRYEVRRWNGLYVATFPRLLIERARVATPKELQALITFGVRKRLVNPKDVENAFERHARCPGLANAKAAFARYRPHPERKSNFEYSFDEVMATRPDIPPYEKNFRMGIWEIDAWFPAQRVAVELDARDYHAAIQDFDKDRKKDAELILMNAKPLRITEFIWEYDRQSAIADLEAMLGLKEPVFLQPRY
jgi:hypothetical protein